MATMKATELVKRLKDIAQNYKTLYVMGCFGAPLTGGNVARYCTNHSYNKAADRTAMIKAAADKNPPIYGFDCVCLIKGVLWGWNGDASKTYGGAGYAVNGVPDIGADTMITKCAGVTTDFSKIEVGEAVWCAGHIGVYIGDGLAVECTPRWANNVQITAVANMGKKSGYNARTWTKHGKLPYIEYGGTAESGGEPSTGGGASGALAVGDVVTFTGTTHYTSANAAAGKACKGGKAKITQIYAGGKHPYHLVRVEGGGASVYGWVDAADISGAGGGAAATIKAGSVVRVKSGAKTYTGGNLAAFVYTRDHVVKQINGDRVVITYGGAVVAAVKMADLTPA